MGYRVRLGRIPKVEKLKYDGKSLKEVNEMLGKKFTLYSPPEYRELYEIGKYVEYSEGRTSFYSFDVYEESEYEFDILSREGLLRIIEAYHQDVYKFYNELFEEYSAIINAHDENEEDWEDFRNEIGSHLYRMTCEWSDSFRIKPYRLESREGMDGEISGSWLKEYAIFNLAHIFRNFDWKNDYLIYSGW